jgi:hypothetical protein
VKAWKITGVPLIGAIATVIVSAVQREFRKHSWDIFVDEPVSVAQGGCTATGNAAAEEMAGSGKAEEGMAKESEMTKTGVLLALFAGISALAGSDPWEGKPYAQWTEQDVAVVLQTSPWVKTVTAVGAWRPMGSHAALPIGQDPHVGTAQADSAIHPTGPQMYNILWGSARTVRAATMRRAVLRGTMKQEELEKGIAHVPGEYMILVKAQDMTIFQQRGETAFMNATFLQAKKSKQKILPSHVAFIRSADQTVTGAVFYFPKKEAAISSEEKEIDFYLQIGESKLLTSFDLRKMVDSQGLDL